jgi:hypothetical protein
MYNSELVKLYFYLNFGISNTFQKVWELNWAVECLNKSIIIDICFPKMHHFQTRETYSCTGIKV